MHVKLVKFMNMIHRLYQFKKTSKTNSQNTEREDGYFETLVCHLLSQPALLIKSHSLPQKTKQNKQTEKIKEIEEIFLKARLKEFGLGEVGIRCLV